VIDSPQFTYKGIVYGEGSIQMNLKVLPRETPEDTRNAKCQIQKCLFLVENKSRIHFKQLIQKKEKERDKVVEERKKVQEKNDYQALAKIDETVTHLQAELLELEQQKALEDLNNQEMNRQK
jgi:hypothetical protein